MCGTGDTNNVMEVAEVAIAGCGGVCVLIGTGAGHSMALMEV